MKERARKLEGMFLGFICQNDSDDNERPIAYYSFALNNAQKNYGVTKLEMLALVSAIRHFRPYLYGSKFLCRVDHHSLIWLKNMRNPMGILARWLETLSNYNFTVQHRPGKLHTNVDALSRLPYDNADSPENIYTTSHLSQRWHERLFFLHFANSIVSSD